MRLIFFFTLLFCFSQKAYAQYIDSLIHYSVENGLSSNMVFRAVEDSKGFMWFLTTRGLSRFDGTRFKYFTTADGLPVNNVFVMGEDSKQRIWLNTTEKFFVYFDINENKLYSTPNKTDAPQKGFFQYIYETPSGGLTFYGSSNTVYELDKQLKVVSWKKNEQKLIVTTKNFPKVNSSVSYYLFGKDSVYTLKQGENLPKTIQHYPTGYGIARVLTDSAFFYIRGQKIVCYSGNVEVEKDISVLSTFKDSLSIQISGIGASDKILVKTGKELFIVDKSLKRLKEFDFINAYNINTVFFDKKENFWLCTFDQGVFVKTKIKKRALLPLFFTNQVINAVASDKKGNVVVGTGKGDLLILKDGVERKINIKGGTNTNVSGLGFNAKGNLFVSWNNFGYTIIPAHLLYTDAAISLQKIVDLRTLDKKNPLHKSVKVLYQSGTVGYVSSDDLRTYALTSTGDFAIGLASNNVRLIKDSDDSWESTLLFDQGSPSLIANAPDNSFWMTHTASSSFLLLTKDRKIDSLLALRKKIPLLDRNLYPGITDLDKNLWTSRSKVGMYRFNLEKREVKTIEEMVRDFVVCIEVDNRNRKWVATNNGVCMIDVLSESPFKYRFKRFDKSYGLPTNEITHISCDGDKIYVGHDRGLSIFNMATLLLETKPEKSDVALHFSNLKINQKDTLLQANYNLRYDENNLEIDFAGLNFDPQNPIRYEYRMQKQGTPEVEWRTTNEPRLVFSFLPAGKYTLHVRAFDLENHLLEMEQPLVFNVRLPFWKTGWFMGSVFTILGVSAWFLYKNNINRIKKEEAEKAEISKQFTVLELQALQAQMNPHFVFNALTAIQNFIWNKDVKAANEYLTEFSTLMRLFLESSRRKYLTVEEEMKLLKIYVHLEQLRFPDRFDVNFNITEDILVTDELPSMLIQPFVENAINHGLLYKKEKGLLQVYFSKQNNVITCIVEDNGVGRAAAAAKQASSIKSHKSRATEILQERIALMKSVEGMEVTVNIEDKNLNNSQNFGTKVWIEIKET
jgi:ligand-binding sensor domain-containing protein